MAMYLLEENKIKVTINLVNAALQNYHKLLQKLFWKAVRLSILKEPKPAKLNSLSFLFNFPFSMLLLRVKKIIFFKCNFFKM